VTVGRETVTVYRRKTPQGNWSYRVENYATGERDFDNYPTEPEAMDAAQTLARRLSTRQLLVAGMQENQAMEYIRATEVLQPFNVTVGAAAETMAQYLTKVGDMLALNDAIKFYAERHKKITNKRVADVIIELLEKKKNKSTRYVASLRSRLQNVFAPNFPCNIGSITTPQLQAWLDSKNFESEQTYRDYRSNLYLLFGFAKRRNYAVDNQAMEIEAADISRDGEVGHYTPDEIAKLLLAATPEFLPCLALGAFAGLRSNEIERLDWSHIDLVEKLIRVPGKVAKTGIVRIVPMHDNLVAWLTPYAEQKGKVWKGSHYGYYDAQSATSVKAEVDWVHNGLRHSYGSYRFAETCDIGRLSGEMGNSPSVIKKHYLHIIKPAEAIKWFGVQPETPANVVTLSATAS
jgi:integrase